MDYAQLLGMTGGNQQSAGIMQNALGAGNVGAQLLGASGSQVPRAPLPGAGFQGFGAQTAIPDLLAKYQAEAAAAPPVQHYQPQMQAPVQAPAPVPAPIPQQQMMPINQHTATDAQRQAYFQTGVLPDNYQFDTTGMYMPQDRGIWNSGVNGMGYVIYPQGGGPGGGNNDG
jgi:hypothetical protein